MTRSPAPEALAALAHDPDERIRLLAAEVLRLREGIGAHRRATGHELCWLNDVELWKLLEADPHYPHETLPVREEFLNQCRCYYELRIADTPYAEPQPRCTVTDKK